MKSTTDYPINPIQTMGRENLQSNELLELIFQSQANQVHAMRWPGGNYILNLL
ncbi:MAG: hypothetical protein HC811_03175 [Flammeovirgaceae bacterium]|nr:hypothetical protein [Flammeovirgaceae bacterium]